MTTCGGRGTVLSAAAQGILCRWDTQLVDQCDSCLCAGGDFFLTAAIPSPVRLQLYMLHRFYHDCNISREALNQV
jgi:hypothetical protein